MKRLVLTSALILWASAAIAIETAAVVSSVTYVDGETRPLTLNTSGELRVTCN